MNPTPYPEIAPDVPWFSGGTRAQVPDTSMLPGSKSAPPPAVGMLKHAVQGAHATIDRLADKAEPVVQQLGINVEAATQAIHAKTHQLRDTRDVWVEDARTAVRRHPLASVAAAFALGAAIVRISRKP
jgi:ElaB/YqjD/DUF883 family membrane-anchored ribosome-binding protein